MLQSGQIAIDDAIARVEHAAWIAHGQGAIALEWRAATTLARLLEKAGRIEEARQQLGDACGGESAGLDSRELDAAKALLVSLT